LEKKSKQAGYLHIQLRIPPELHKLVVDYADSNKLSINGAMLTLLESALLQGISQRDVVVSETVDLLNEVKKMQERLQKDLADIPAVKKLLESYVVESEKKI
jgi:hypothetical protein